MTSFIQMTSLGSEGHGSSWHDWRWHMKNVINNVEKLSAWVNVSERECAAIALSAGKYRWQVTPYYASLMDRDDPQCPIRRQAIPDIDEFVDSTGPTVDPVGDRLFRKTNRIIHKYPDRVVLLVTEICPVYCRHCTRKYHTTDIEGTYFSEDEAVPFSEDLEYIASHPEVRDVLLTGGDPLSYSDRRLGLLLQGLREIPHVGVIRIGTRFPVLLPQRITDEFCQMLEDYHPVWLSTHFNHPKEITGEAAHACDLLLRHGVPVQNQTVLLRGINDSVEIMDKLLSELVRIRVRPYYLYHCDNVTGASHFRTTVQKGRAIMAKLHGRIAGFAMPRYVVTTELGKIPAERSYLEIKDNFLQVEGYDGRIMDLGSDTDE